MQSNASVAIDGLRKLKCSMAKPEYIKLLDFFRKVVTNIWDHPYEEKYRRVNKANVTVKLAKWKAETDGLLFLFQIGFEQSASGEHLHMPRNVLLADLKRRLTTEVAKESGDFEAPRSMLERADLAMAIALSKSVTTKEEAKERDDSGHAMLPYERAISAERDPGLGNRTRMIDWVSRQKYKELHSNFEPKLIPSRGNNNCFWNALYLALQGPYLWSELFARGTFKRHHERVMNLKAGVAEYVAIQAKPSSGKAKLVADILADNIQAGDEMFGWVASSLDIELSILGPDYNDQALLLNEMHNGVMQWRPDIRLKHIEKSMLAKLRNNPESRVGITMYNKVNVHFDLLVSRDMIPSLVNCSDSDVPRLKQSDRGYIVLGEQKDEDTDLARAFAMSKQEAECEEKIDVDVSKKSSEAARSRSNSLELEDSWEDLAQALAMSEQD